jgi:hypothetical protein
VSSVSTDSTTVSRHPAQKTRLVEEVDATAWPEPVQKSHRGMHAASLKHGVDQGNLGAGHRLLELGGPATSTKLEPAPPEQAGKGMAPAIVSSVKIGYELGTG